MWLVVAGLTAFVLVVAGLVRGGTGALPDDAPVVDVVSEDQAIAALALYHTEARAVDALQTAADILAPPGPPAAAAAAGQAAGAVQTALERARAQPGPDPLVAAYWNDGGHTSFVDHLTTLRTEAELVALLAATHDTIYGGAGAIPLRDAQERMLSAFGSARPAPLVAWAEALLYQLEDADRRDAAAQARETTRRWWAGRVMTLSPPAVDRLTTYVDALPRTTRRGLRGNPVAGPAIEHLRGAGRLVSQRGGTPSP